MFKALRKPGVLVILILTLLASACAPAAQPTAVSEPPTAPPAATQAAAPAETTAPAETSAPVSGEKTQLSILTNWGDSDKKGEVLKIIVADFMAANPDIEVTIEVVPDTDMATKVETSFLAEQEADIILHNWLGPSKEWLSDGVTIPITQYLKDWGLQEKFKETALNDFRVGEDYAAFPIEGFNWPMWYNMEILEKAGVTDIPTTFEELTEVATKVRDAGYQPFALGGKDWTGGDWFLTVATAALGNEQAAELFGNGGFAQNDDARKFVEGFVNLRDSGVFMDNVEGMDFDTMNAAFFEGKAGIMHGGSWSYADLPEALQTKVTLGGIPLPSDGKGAQQPFWYSSFEAKGLWISRNGAQKLDVVEKFSKFFFQDEYMAQFVEQSAMIHPFNELEIDETVLAPVFVQSLGLDVETVKHATVAFAPTNTFDAWYDVTATAFVPGTSVDEILKAMDDIYTQ
jgi:multiple sugar transport system substrate-binding protein